MATYKIDADGKRVLVHATQPPQPKDKPQAESEPAEIATQEIIEDKDNG